MDIELKFRRLEGEGDDLCAVFTLAHSDQGYSWSKQELEDEYYRQDENEHGFRLPEDEVAMALKEMGGP